MGMARVTLAAALLFLQGCAAMQSARNNEMDRILATGDYKGAAMLAESRMGLNPNEDGGLPDVSFQRANVLDHLDAAEAWRLMKDGKRSNLHYDAAEEALKDVELQSGASVAGKQVGAMLLNDSVLDYVPSPAEAILMNYYKAINFLSQGDPDNARVELNRADDRTRRAVERYEEEIAEAQSAAEEKNSDSTYQNSSVRSGIDARYPEMSQWAPYREFIVPPATYLQALYLSRSEDPGDRQRGAELFTRVAGLVENNSAVTQDAAEAAAGDICPNDDCVWLLIEHGLGPVLEERRMDLSILTPTNGLLVVSFALPALVSRSGETEVPFQVLANNTPVTPQPLAEMDRVIQTEFQKRFPGIATRAVVSATLKAVAQKTINDRSGGSADPYAALFNLIGSAVSIATTAADTRMWRSMPGRFALVRVQKTPEMNLSLKNGTFEVPVTLPAKGCQLVHVRSTSPGVAPIVEVIGL